MGCCTQTHTFIEGDENYFIFLILLLLFCQIIKENKQFLNSREDCGCLAIGGALRAIVGGSQVLGANGLCSALPQR